MYLFWILALNEVMQELSEVNRKEEDLRKIQEQKEKDLKKEEGLDFLYGHFWNG